MTTARSRTAGVSAALALSLALTGTALAQTAPVAAADVAMPDVPPPPPPPASMDWRTVPAEDLMVIDTTRGRILIELLPEIAPLHVERMRLLARAGFFDGIVWHRVIDLFMAQTGDPLGTGEGQSPYPDLKGEFTFRRGPEMAFTTVAAPAGAAVGFFRSLPVQTQPDSLMATTSDGKVHGWGLYCPGVAGMARDEGNDTANSQFFIMRQPYPSLDKRYTIWGKAVSGLEVVRAIKVGEGAGGIVAGQPDRMTRVRIAADLPEADRPTVQVLDTASPRFLAMAAETRTSRGADFSMCDIELPVQISGATGPALP